MPIKKYNIASRIVFLF